MALPATQVDMINYLRHNFWKMEDDALFTSLKTITNSTDYQNTPDAAASITIQNCSDLIKTLGIPIDIDWSWITDEMDPNANYTINVVALNSGVLRITISGSFLIVSVKAFLIRLDNTVGLENFQFRCIDQRDNSLNFRIGRFPSNFLELFPSISYKFEIRPIFCDNHGMIYRDWEESEGARHADRPRIMEEYGRGDDPFVTLPKCLNSVLTMNVENDSGLEPGENLASMHAQIDPGVQSDYVDRGHRLLNEPYLYGGYGKAKILNDFHGQGYISRLESGSYVFGRGDQFIPECGGLGPKNSTLTWSRLDNQIFFTQWGNITYKPYVWQLSATEISRNTSDTPAWDSTLTCCQFDLAHYCRHKRINMSNNGPGWIGRASDDPLYHSYSRVQYTMALIIWKYQNHSHHYEPFAIIADQGRFFDFEEDIGTTWDKLVTVSGHISRLVRTNGGFMFAPESGINALSFASSASLDWNQFSGTHIWLSNGYYGYLKKVSISGNTITVKGDLMPTVANTWDDTRYCGIQATINTSAWSSNKRITITSLQEPIAHNLIIGAAIYYYN